MHTISYASQIPVVLRMKSCALNAASQGVECSLVLEHNICPTTVNFMISHKNKQTANITNLTNHNDLLFNTRRQLVSKTNNDVKVRFSQL